MELRGRYVTLLNEVAKRRPSTILEIGTHCGNSAIRMVAVAEMYNDDIFYYGFDIFDWGDQDFMKAEFKKFSPDRYIDFVFIDGGHSVETIESDWNYIKHLMGKQTVVVFDDYYENRDDFGCKKLIDNLQKEKNYKIEKLDPLEVVEKNNIELRLVKVTKCQ